MPKTGLYLLRMGSLRDEDRRAGVTQIVEPESFGKAGCLDGRLPVSSPEVRTPQESASIPDEYKGLRADRLEVEVESVAHIVCDAIGLDSGDYSFAYVARWAEGSTDLLKETGGRVMGCAQSLLKALESVGSTVPEAL
jgi:hypothetical protein